MTEITTTVKDNQIYPITSEDGNIEIIVNVDESEYTDKMKEELVGVLFEFLLDNGLDGGTEYISIKDRNLLWNQREDMSLSIIGIPKECYVKTTLIYDEYYLEKKAKERQDAIDKGESIIPEEVTEFDTEFPFTIYYESFSIGGSSEGSGEDTKYIEDALDEINGEVI